MTAQLVADAGLRARMGAAARAEVRLLLMRAGGGLLAVGGWARPRACSRAWPCEAAADCWLHARAPVSTLVLDV